MDSGAMEGDRERESSVSPPPEEDSGKPKDTGETAEDSGVTVPPNDEGGSEEQPVHDETISQSHSDAALNTASQSEQGDGEMPVPPRPPLPLSGPRSEGEGAEGAEAGGVDEEPQDEEELVVLDPEHPLMKRFQSALKNQLRKQLERLNLELRENLAAERAEAARREELGVMLYSVQQELARQQAALEGRHETNAQAATLRRQAQEQLEALKGRHRAVDNQVKQQRSHASQLQAEVDSLAQRLLYMEGVNTELRSDVSAMKNASRKAQTEKSQAEEQKYKQDLYVERLTKHMEKLTEQIALYETQTIAQAEESKAAKEALAEAQMEMDSLAVERKQLMQQWNSSLLGMRRRNEAYTAMQEALRQANHQVRSLDTEIEGYKNSITQEEEKNELMTVVLKRAELAGATARKVIARSHGQQEALQAQYSTYARMLEETENALGRLTIESSVRRSELMGLRKQMERESAMRLELEDKIVRKMQEQLTHDNAAKYSRRLTDRMAAHKKELEDQLSRQEEEIAAVSLAGSEAALRLEALGRLQAQLEGEISQRHNLLSASEAQIANQVLVIERRQATIDLYNKKIEQIAASTGHEDLGPLEIKAKALTKQLEEVAAEMKGQQQLWLWQQGELVRLTQERQDQSSALQSLQSQLTILQQRRVRTEAEIGGEGREQAELERHMKQLRGDMLKLNSLLGENSRLRLALEQDNVLTERHFLQRLKEAERDSIEMQMRLEKIKEEKDRLLNSLVEAERQIMLWEKKTQLARETRSAVDSEMGQGDIHIMKAEIHRMEVRYAQLVKQQEQLLRDMEAAVARRESIVARSEALARADRKQPTRTSLHSILQSLRRKIVETQKQAEECDGVIGEMRESQGSLSSSLVEKQQQLSDLHNASAVLTSDLCGLQDTRERNLAWLLTLQGRAKQLQAVREGHYSAVAPSEAALGPAVRRQEERLSAVGSVLQRLAEECPQHRDALRRITLTLANHRPTEPQQGC